MAGGVLDTVPPQAPNFVHDYFDYYKTPRGYHKRSGNHRFNGLRRSPAHWRGFLLFKSLRCHRFRFPAPSDTLQTPRRLSIR